MIGQDGPMNRLDRLISESGEPFTRAERKVLEGGQSQSDAWSAVAVLYSAKMIKRALATHAEALNRSAAVAEKHARGLKSATWALMGATAALVVTSLLQAVL